MDIKTIQREQIFTAMIYEKNTVILALNEQVAGLENENKKLQTELAELKKIVLNKEVKK